MLEPEFFRRKCLVGLDFSSYVASGTARQQETWAAAASRASLTEAQQSLIQGFTRELNVLVLSGLWCGDCVQQCPSFDLFERTNPRLVKVRFLDRDANLDLARPLMICGGLRVPTVVFLNEDFEFVSILGDRTLARYRTMAAKHLGPSCPLPGADVPADEAAATRQDWLDEFERVQLLLRLSPKLRERHAD